MDNQIRFMQKVYRATNRRKESTRSEDYRNPESEDKLEDKLKYQTDKKQENLEFLTKSSRKSE